MIYLGADHRGFALKEKIKKWLKRWGYKFEDCGNKVYEPNDDYPDFAVFVAQKVKNNLGRNFGILICGSGIGVSLTANKFSKIRCGLGFDKKQIEHARKNDDINILSLPSDYLSYQKAKELVKIFLKTEFSGKEKYKRRIEKASENF